MTDAAGIPAVIDAIRHLHDCGAKHVETVHVRDTAPNGEVAWDGDVEVFDWIGYAKVTHSRGVARPADEAMKHAHGRRARTAGREGRCGAHCARHGPTRPLGVGRSAVFAGRPCSTNGRRPDEARRTSQQNLWASASAVVQFIDPEALNAKAKKAATARNTNATR